MTFIPDPPPMRYCGNGEGRTTTTFKKKDNQTRQDESKSSTIFSVSATDVVALNNNKTARNISKNFSPASQKVGLSQKFSFFGDLIFHFGKCKKLCSSFNIFRDFPGSNDCSTFSQASKILKFSANVLSPDFVSGNFLKFSTNVLSPDFGSRILKCLAKTSKHHKLN